MGDGGIGSEPAHLVLLVVLEVALEPLDVAIALERQNVRGDAVEEPAIVADDDRAAGEILERLLERAQRVDVEIVRGLVEQEHVGTRLEHLGEMHAVALAARQRADLLLLVGAHEVEVGAIGARIHLALAEQDDVLLTRDFLPDVLLAVERIAGLIDIAEMDRFADLDRALVRFFLPDDHAEQRRLAGAVRADHPDDAAGRKPEGEIIDQEVVAVAFLEPLEVDDVLSEPLRHRDDDLRALGGLLRGLLHQVLVALIARLGFGLPRARGGRDPFLLAGERALARGFLAALLLEPLLLLREPGRVIALVGDAAAAIELEDPAGHVIEEIAVVGDDQDRTGIIAQMALEPADGLGVEMVGGLVEQEQVRLLKKQPAERHPPPDSVLTSASSGGQRSASIAWSILESRSHRPLASISSCSLVISSAVSSE